MAKKININPNDFEPIVVNGCLVEANTIYEIVAKEPSDKSPDIYTRLGSVKERFPGVGNTASLAQGDSGFFDASPIFNTIDGVKNNWIKRKELADKYFEIFAEPMKNYISEIQRIRIPTDDEFFDKHYPGGYFSTEIGEGKQFNTANPKERFKLYIALIDGQLAMKGKRTDEEKEVGLKDELDMFHQDAQYCYQSLTEKKSKGELMAELEMTASFEFGNLLRSDKNVLIGLLSYINIPIKKEISLSELNTIYKLKIESEPRKLKEFMGIMDLYKENPKQLIEEIDLLDKLKSKKGRELVTKQGSSFYMDEIVLGSNMKSVAATLLKPESVDLLKKFYLNFD